MAETTIPATSEGAVGASVYLDTRQAATLLRLSTRSLERMRMSGDGPPFVAAGRRRLYRVADLEMWTAARTVRSTSEADAKARMLGLEIPNDKRHT